MSCPCSTTNNGASRLSMINAAITIIYSPKTMFHAVHPCSFAVLSFDLLLSLPSLSFCRCARSESAVSTFPVSFPEADLCKKFQNTSPWGSTPRLINRAGRAAGCARVRSCDWKSEGFSACEGAFYESRETDPFVHTAIVDHRCPRVQ